jgi:hypothetical protein
MGVNNDHLRVGCLHIVRRWGTMLHSYPHVIKVYDCGAGSTSKSSTSNKSVAFGGITY